MNHVKLPCALVRWLELLAERSIVESRNYGALNCPEVECTVTMEAAMMLPAQRVRYRVRIEAAARRRSEMR